jgi:WD40 repeat protein
MSDHPQSPGDKIANRSAHPPPTAGSDGASDQAWEFRRDTEYLYQEVPNIAKPGVEPEPVAASNGKAKAGGVGFVIFIIIYAIIRVIASSARHNPPPPQVNVQFPPPKFQMPPAVEWKVDALDGAGGVPLAQPGGAIPPLPVLPIRTFRDGHQGGILAFATNDDTLITAGHDGLLWTWSLRDGQQIRQLQGHVGAVTSVVMGKGNTALSGGFDGKVRLWDLSTGNARKVFGPYPSGVTAVALAPDEKRFVVACGLRDIRYAFQPAIGFGAAPAQGKPGRETLHWDRPMKSVRQAYIVNIETGKIEKTISGHQDELTCAAFTPDGLLVVTGSLDKTLRMWETATGRDVWRFDEAGEVLALAVSPDGTQLLSGAGKLGSAPGRSPSTDRLLTHNPLVQGIGHRKDQGSARVWDLRNGQFVRTLSDLDFPVLSVAFDAAGDRYAVGDFGGKIRLWRRGQDQPVATYTAGRAVSHVRFLADGGLLSSSWNSFVSQWAR